MKRRSHALMMLALLSSITIAQDGVWRSENPIPTNGLAKTHAAGVEQSGRLYVLGGPPWLNGPSMEDGTVYSMPLGGGAWQEEIAFDGYGGLLWFGGGLDDLGRIVIFGGYDINNPTDPQTPFEWDQSEGPWHDLAPRSAGAPGVGFATCTDDQGRIYSLGGSGASYCERYIGSLDQWEPIAPMPIVLSHAAACLDGLGHILVFGGLNADASARSSAVLEYDIASNTWSMNTNTAMPAGVSNHKAALAADGRIYVMGGIEGDLSSPTTVNTVRVYDPRLDSWSDGPPMSTPRRNFSVIQGSDGRTYVMGGENDTGGTASVESIYATPCPIVFEQPSDRTVWEFADLRLNAGVSSAGNTSYQWSREGIPLSNGPQSDGSTINGADTNSLLIQSLPSSAEGSYTLSISNSCGSVTTSPAMVSVNIPPDLSNRVWTWTSLHPSFAISSYANSIDNGVQVGDAVFDTPDYNGIDHPVRWTGTAASVVNLTPGGSQGGNISDFSGDKLVGWWWAPIQCYVNHQWLTCYYRRGAWWSLDGTFHETNYSGYEYTSMSATDGVTVVGSGSTDDDVGNVYTKAVIWQAPTHEFAYSLHPAGYRNSWAGAVDGEYQFGSASLPFAVVHAAMWHGTSASFVDMHPSWAGNSSIVDASDGQQIGVVNQWNNPHAVIWEGSPESILDVNPVGAISSTLSACDQGLQIGSAIFPDDPSAQPGIWASSAHSFTSLSGIVPSDYLGFSMNDIELAPDGTISMVGSSYNSTLGRTEAILVTSAIAPSCIADFTGDGTLDFFDVSAFLGAFSASLPSADLNNDSQHDFFDISIFLSAFSAGCP